MNVNNAKILTVGHSSLSYDRFLELVKRAGVTAIADVRSSPYSRLFPQFNQNALSNDLRADGISYVFMGDELGGRPKDSNLYCDGIADYERMSTTAAFKKGLSRLTIGAKDHRIAVMCSERNPLDCHRCLLVGRALAQRGLDVGHILSDGSVIGQSEIEDQLLEMAGQADDDFFAPRSERLAQAYRNRSRKVAFTERGDHSNNEKHGERLL